MSIDPSAVAWDENGMVPAVIQDERTGRLLMLAYMNREALDLTLTRRSVHFWSRSRRALWRKGETSGHTLELVEAHLDCDGDTVLVVARPSGPICHTGTDTCFDDGPLGVGFAGLESLWATIRQRAELRPEGSYTTTLLQGGPDLPARKVVEEATEVLIAAKDHAAGINDHRLAEEMADLVYHLLVVCADRDLDPGAVVSVLAARASAVSSNPARPPTDP